MLYFKILAKHRYTGGTESKLGTLRLLLLGGIIENWALYANEVRILIFEKNCDRCGTRNLPNFLLPNCTVPFWFLSVHAPTWSHECTHTQSAVPVCVWTIVHTHATAVLTGFIKRYTYSALHTWVFPHILSYKIFSFCEQIRKIGANDLLQMGASGASGQELQYSLEK